MFIKEKLILLINIIINLSLIYYYVFKWKRRLFKRREKRRGRQYEKEEEEKVGVEGARMCFWNIAGVLNKDKEVWEYLSNFELVSLMETWVEEDG